MFDILRSWYILRHANAMHPILKEYIRPHMGNLKSPSWEIWTLLGKHSAPSLCYHLKIFSCYTITSTSAYWMHVSVSSVGLYARKLFNNTHYILCVDWHDRMNAAILQNLILLAIKFASIGLASFTSADQTTNVTCRDILFNCCMFSKASVIKDK